MDQLADKSHDTLFQLAMGQLDHQVLICGSSAKKLIVTRRKVARNEGVRDKTNTKSSL